MTIRGALRAMAVVACAAALQACAVENGMSIYLPQGDAGRGREAFSDLRCHYCHEIEGLDLPAPIMAETRVVLGDRTAGITSYGDLVTSIVNPSHRLARGYPLDAITVNGKSVMSLIYLNELMTVQQLVDIAAFLQREYEVVPSPPPDWETYPSNSAAVARALSGF